LNGIDSYIPPSYICIYKGKYRSSSLHHSPAGIPAGEEVGILEIKMRLESPNGLVTVLTWKLTDIVLGYIYT
jgi:hypothetical protein